MPSLFLEHLTWVEAEAAFARTPEIGDPTRATAAKGEAILSAMAADVAAFCVAWQ